MTYIWIGIIVALIGLLVWIYKIASGVLGPWRLQNRWSREEHEQKILEDREKE